MWSLNKPNIVKWKALLQICATIILTMLQITTSEIHYYQWKNCLSNQIEKRLGGKYKMLVTQDTRHSLNEFVDVFNLDNNKEVVHHEDIAKPFGF